MNLSFREASIEDVALLRAFESQLINYERALEPTLIQTGHLEYYDIPKLITDQNARIIIVEVDNKPVGCGLGQIKENDACYNEKKYGYIGLMYVMPDQRGKNIGGLVMQQLVNWFKERNISEVRLKVYAKNSIAIQSYEKFGFEHYIQEMKLKR